MVKYNNCSDDAKISVAAITIFLKTIATTDGSKGGLFDEGEVSLPSFQKMVDQHRSAFLPRKGAFQTYVDTPTAPQRIRETNKRMKTSRETSTAKKKGWTCLFLFLCLF